MTKKVKVSNQAEQFARYKYRTNKRAAEKVADGLAVSLEWYDDYCDIYHWTATDGNKTIWIATESNGTVFDMVTENGDEVDIHLT